MSGLNQVVQNPTILCPQSRHNGQHSSLDYSRGAATWDAPRRLVMKAEWLDKGANPRFVLTNLELLPQAFYDRFYVQRGADSEHRIKELKLGIQADRLSCSNFTQLL